MSGRLRGILGWVHCYIGLVLGLEHPGTGALFVAVGICWWMKPHG